MNTPCTNKLPLLEDLGIRSAGKLENEGLLRSGFTLLELLIVIAIIGITLGYVGPRIRFSVFSSSIDEGTREIMAMLKYARSSAITRHEEYLVHFDLSSSVVGVYPNPTSSGEVPKMEKKARLPRGVIIKAIKTPYAPEKEEGKIDLMVNKDGLVEQGIIYLEGPGSKVYTLVIKPYSGDLKIYDHYVEFSHGYDVNE